MFWDFLNFNTGTQWRSTFNYRCRKIKQITIFCLWSLKFKFQYFPSFFLVCILYFLKRNLENSEIPNRYQVTAGHSIEIEFIEYTWWTKQIVKTPNIIKSCMNLLNMINVLQAIKMVNISKSVWKSFKNLRTKRFERKMSKCIQTNKLDYKMNKNKLFIIIKTTGHRED